MSNLFQEFFNLCVIEIIVWQWFNLCVGKKSCEVTCKHFIFNNSDNVSALSDYVFFVHDYNISEIKTGASIICNYLVDFNSQIFFWESFFKRGQMFFSRWFGSEVAIPCIFIESTKASVRLVKLAVFKFCDWVFHGIFRSRSAFENLSRSFICASGKWLFVTKTFVPQKIP